MRKSLFLLGAAVVLATAPASAQKITIRAATFTPERSITVTYAFKPWIAAVEKELGGDVKIQGYWGGSLGRNPRKQLDLVLDGVADVASVVPGYTPGKFPGFSIFELPYLFRSGTEASEAMWRMLQANQLKGFDKVKVVGFYATDTYGFHTKKPMKSLEDVKGMKIRIAGPVQAETAKFFGAVPIGMPITQATEALSRGVIDGGLFGYSGLTIFRMQTIAKYHYSGPLSSAPLTSLMNKKKWDSLPKRVQAAIDKHGGAQMGKVGGGGFDKTAKIFKGKMVKAGGHHFIEWDGSTLQADLKRVKPIHDWWIKRTDNGQQMYATLTKIIADIRAGR